MRPLRARSVSQAPSLLVGQIKTQRPLDSTGGEMSLLLDGKSGKATLQKACAVGRIDHL